MGILVKFTIFQAVLWSAPRFMHEESPKIGAEPRDHSPPVIVLTIYCGFHFDVHLGIVRFTYKKVTSLSQANENGKG